MEHRWYTWINEPIFLDETTILPRKEAIAYFCKEGLFPFVKHQGYRFRLHDAGIIKYVLKVLFFISEKKKVYPSAHAKEIPHLEEQYFHYCSRLDTIAWMEFWETWKLFQDFQEGHYGYNFRFSIPEFIWSWIDLVDSETAIAVEQELDEKEYEDSKGKEDPYLQDTYKRDYQDRHWF